MSESSMVRAEPGARFSDAIGRLFGERFPSFAASGLWDEGLLPVDISRNDQEVIVRASLPGFKKEDVEVQLNDGVLSIKAERTSESETTDERYYRKERRYGAVSRRVALPGIVGSAEAAAELQNGVLTVCVPVTEAAKPKRVEIKG